MEFHEKLQELRKSRELTQEELAEALFVSRTAVSKWESGRGYPSIDSLKELSRFFSVTIDELLSGEKLISLAEQENRSNLQRMCGVLFGIADVLAVLLIVMPLYPHTVGDYIYSVNLLRYAEVAPFSRAAYWVMFLTLAAAGGVELLLTNRQPEKSRRPLTVFSVGLHIVMILFLAMSREAYGVSMAFLLFLLKAAALLKGEGTRH